MRSIRTGVNVFCLAALWAAVSVAGAEAKDPRSVTDAKRAIQETEEYLKSAVENYKPSSSSPDPFMLVDWKGKVPDSEAALAKWMNKDKFGSARDWATYFDNIVLQIKHNTRLRAEKEKALRKKYYLKPNDISEKVYNKYYQPNGDNDHLQAKMDELAKELNPKLYARHQALPQEIADIDAQLAALTRMLYDLPDEYGRWQGQDHKGVSVDDVYAGMNTNSPAINIKINVPGSPKNAKEEEAAPRQAPVPVESELEPEVWQQVIEEHIAQDPEARKDMEPLGRIKEAYQKAQENSADTSIPPEQLNQVIEELFSDPHNQGQSGFEIFNEHMDDPSQTVQVASVDRGRMKVVDTEAAEAFKKSMQAMDEASDLGGDLSSALDTYGQIGGKMTDAATTAANKWVTRGEEVHNMNFTKASELFEAQGKNPSPDTRLEFDVEGRTVSATVDHWRPVSINGQMYYLAEDSLGNPSGLLIRFEERPKWVIFSDETIEVYHTDPDTIKKADTEYTAMRDPEKIQSITK
jgi:hypothetical protein